MKKIVQPMKFCWLFAALVIGISLQTGASIPPPNKNQATNKPRPLMKLKKIEKGVEVLAPEKGAIKIRPLQSFSEKRGVSLAHSSESPLIFDFPVTYNKKVKYWVRFFQGRGRKWYRKWLERSTRFLPKIQRILTQDGLPLDLAYIAMIESGYSARAISVASAVGPWQFIKPTANRYGLRVTWWLDERRDIDKSTRAAANYLSDLYKMFNSWYLVAAAYNTGEGRVQRLIRKHKTRDYWQLVRYRALPKETRDYVPKLIAAMMIAKAPGLYGFRALNHKEPFSYQYYNAPGGTDIVNLAKHLGVSRKHIQDLNPELLKGFIPQDVDTHRIRIPKGSLTLVAEYMRTRLNQLQ